MKKTISFLLCFVLVAVLTLPSFAFSSTKKPATSSKQVTLKIMFEENELGATNADFAKVYPNIKLQFMKADPNKLMTMLAAGNGPDIIRCFGATELPSFVAKGLATDLTSYIKKSSNSALRNTKDFLPVMDLFRFDGKVQGKGPLYGIAKDWSPDFTILYNKKLLAEAGIAAPSDTVPMTWNQLFDNAKKLVKKDGTKTTQWGLGVYCSDSAHTEFTQNMMMMMLKQKGKSLYSADNSKSNFNTPEIKSIMNLWADAVKANIGPNSLNTSGEWVGQSFCDGKLPYLLIGYFWTGALRGDKGASTHLDDFGLAPAPVFEGGTRYNPTQTATGAFLYSKGKHKDEAFKTLEYFFAGPGVDARAKTGWGLPVFKSKMGLIPQTTNFDKQTYKVVSQEAKYSSPPLAFNYYLSSGGVNAIINKDFTPVYFDKSTVDEAAKAMTKDVNDLIQDGLDMILGW